MTRAPRRRRTTIAAAIALAGAACGGRSPTAPSDALTEQTVTDHFVFHFSPGDRVDPPFQEAFHAWAVAQLGVAPAVITYNKYRDRAQMGALTGHGNTNGYAEPSLNVLHTINRTETHEVVHVYAGPWGFPVALFVEGLAVAYQTNPQAGDFVPKWSGTPLHDAARQLKATGQLIPVAAITETTAFRAQNELVTYPESGSFVRFLIDTDGIAMMRRLYGAMPGDASSATARAAFLEVYGYGLDEAEARWLRFLDTR